MQSPLTDSNRRPPLYEEGPWVKVRRGAVPGLGGSGGVVVVSGCHLSIASSREDKAGSELAPVAHLLKDRQAARGSVAAFGSEGLVAGEHVPDRFGESAREVDLGDLGAAL